MTAPLFASFALPLVAAVAAAAVGLPVLIHLLSRQRFQVVPWAAMRFLLSAQKRHRRRIDRWLLLAMRVLAIALLLLGLCAASPWAENLWQAIRPGTMSSTVNAPRTHHVFVLDTSLSMATASDNGSRFQKAVAKIETLIRSANPGDGFTLIETSASASAVVPGPANDAEKVVGELRNIKPTHTAGDYSSALPLIADTLAKSPRNYPRRQVTFVTDLQRSAWNPILARTDVPTPEIWQRILTKADMAVLDVAGSDYDNLSIAEMSLGDPLALTDAPVVVLASVQNFGKTDRVSVRVELRVSKPGKNDEGTFVPVEAKVIDKIEAGQRFSVAFVLDGANRFREAGTHLLQVRLPEADDLPADDVRTLAVEVRDAVPCVLVNGKPSTDPFLRASGYLQTALDPTLAPGSVNPLRPRTLSLAEFGDVSLAELAEVDCVFLCDVPSLTPNQLTRIEAHLKRGGGVIIGLGPNAAENMAFYNDVLFNNGNGLLPGKLTGIRKITGPNDAGFVFAADDKAYTLDPLAAFRDDNARAGLTSVPFTQYMKLDAPPDGRARRIVSFVPAKPPVLKAGEQAEKSDPAIVEMPRHRGRVVVYTSSFNRDWTVWPILQSYLPMMHELARYASTNPDRHSLRAGEALEEFFPATAVGLKARVLDPEGTTTDVIISAGEDSGVARYGDTRLSGIYRVQLQGQKPHVFAVNTPDVVPGGGSESDLFRLDTQRLKDLTPNIQIGTEPEQWRFETGESGQTILTPRPWGPTLARWFLSFVLLLLVAETAYAWYVGPSRSAGNINTVGESAPQRSFLRFVWAAFSLLPILVVGVLLFAVGHSYATGHSLGFLPDSWRHQLEVLLGVPGAGPGEGSRWRLEQFPVYLANAMTDRWLVFGLITASAIIVVAMYVRERRTTGRLRRIIVPGLLRLSAIALLGFVLLPQLRIAFDREGWPDIVILLDNSASMSTADAYRDPAVRAKAEGLLREANINEADRLTLAKLLLTRKNSAMLNELLSKRQVKVHVYTVAEQTRMIAELNEDGDTTGATEAIAQQKADGQESKQGEAVKAVLKSFRGGALCAIVMFTDGVVTAGDDLTRAAREAARSSVPLYLVGLGESYDPPDLALSDLKSDDVVIKGDQLVFDLRLTAQGPRPPTSVPVILSEKQGERLIERARQTVTVDTTGKPVPVRLTHIATEVGEKTYVVEVPVQPGETETLNNRIERVVLVTESKRLKVLFVDGQPRYEYRFVKSLLEREIEESRGGRPVELDVLLLDASAGHWQSDRSAERLRGATPTRNQLFEYDVLIFGDVVPSQIPKSNQFFLDMVEFVKTKGGGLLFLAGEHSTPHKLFDTPLGELLPVTLAEGIKAGGPAQTSLETPITETYLPKATPLGRTHPLFRFVPDEADNAAIWESLKPFYWVSTGWRRKATAEVLAVHPSRPAEGNDSSTNHPLVLQQFVGAGRVVFFAFDETWRWRWRSGEERFNHFWTQAVRATAKSRVTRIEIKTDKQTAYRRNEPIRITVRYPDDAPAPPPEQPVKVQVARKPIRVPGRADPVGDNETMNVTLAKVEGTRATYETLLTRTVEGEYDLTLNDATKGKNKPHAEARVLPPAGERDRLDMNRGEMIRAATESRGKFYTLANVDELLNDLPEAERVPLNQPCPPLSVWNHAGLYALMVLLLGLEWWVRRRERLV